MATERLSVVVTRRLPEVVETRMTELFDVELRDEDRPLTKGELVAAMQRADVIVPCITDHIDGAMLAQAGDRLKLVANYGAGVDHIDVATARQRGILVSNTPGVMTDDTADMAMALILAVLRRLPEGMAVMQEGRWDGWAPTAFMGGRVGRKAEAEASWDGRAPCAGRAWRAERPRLRDGAALQQTAVPPAVACTNIGAVGGE